MALQPDGTRFLFTVTGNLETYYRDKLTLIYFEFEDDPEVLLSHINFCLRTLSAALRYPRNDRGNILTVTSVNYKIKISLLY